MCLLIDRSVGRAIVVNKSVFFGGVLDVGGLDTKLLGGFVPAGIRSNKSTTERVSKGMKSRVGMCAMRRSQGSVDGSNWRRRRIQSTRQGR